MISYLVNHRLFQQPRRLGSFARGIPYWGGGMVLAMGVVLLLTAGCKTEKKEEPGAFISFFWGFSKHVPHTAIPTVSIRVSEQLLRGARTFSLGAEEINGKMYSAATYYRAPSVNSDAGRTSLLRIHVRRELTDAGRPIIDIRLSNEIRVQIDVKKFENGWIEDVSTGRKYSPPFIFEPGEYHLHATKNGRS